MSVKEAVSTAEKGISLVKQLDSLAETFRPFRPEVRRMRIDYLNKNSEIKYYLNIPSGVKRSFHQGRIELPITPGFVVDEVLDFDAGELIKTDYNPVNGKWNFYTDSFPSSERYMVTLRGKLSDDFLKRLVDVKCASNPTQRATDECYWIHSALKDVSILEKIWNELDIEKINIDVRIGVERMFTSLLPSEVKKRMEIQKELLTAVMRGDRNINPLKQRYRRISRNVNITPSELYEFFMKLASGEFFSSYLDLEKPFQFSNIEPEKSITSLLPEKIKVGVLTDLNLQIPAVKGELRFKREKYETSVKEKMEELTS
jgi:hypothetical protein